MPLFRVLSYFIFFFFQAEDGIRDLTVTGVQTCALPILLFHILNGSATEIRSLALPGHTFKVVALDGNPVPTPAEVPVLWLGTAERISEIGRASCRERV